MDKHVKKSVIITLAGMSSRFSRSVGRECHKSFYREVPEDDCLLDWQLDLTKRYGFEQIVLVGGYKYDELEKLVQKNHADLPVKLVPNDHYADLGSCYSLCLGVEAVDEDAVSVVFLEGDLLFDSQTFDELAALNDDAITATRSIVDAKTSVAFFTTVAGRLRYVYDTRHESLKVDEPFTRIGNSGQVWQFADVAKLKASVRGLSKDDWKGTNLVPILKYFEGVDARTVRVCQFNAWFNCNTIADYRAMKKYVKEVKNARN